MTLNTRVADDQLGQFYRKTTAIADRLGKSLPFDDVMSALQHIHDGKFNGKAMSQTAAARLLEPFGSPVDVAFDAIEEPFDPFAFFKSREGLWVSEYFQSNILSHAKPVAKLPAASMKSFDLTKNAYDREITPALPKDYAFDVSELLARVAQMIEKQPKGKEGDLQHNGYWNIFYVPGLVVLVYWNAGSRKWYVSAWRLDDHYWNYGNRVFSRN